MRLSRVALLTFSSLGCATSLAQELQYPDLTEGEESVVVEGWSFPSPVANVASCVLSREGTTLHWSLATPTQYIQPTMSDSPSSEATQTDMPREEGDRRLHPPGQEVQSNDREKRSCDEPDTSEGLRD